MTPRHRLIVSCLATSAALAPLAIGALVSPALAGSKDYTICHATSSAKNPYVLIHPAHSGVMHGHLGHQDERDVIPPFQYKGETYSQNWDEDGQALHANGCVAPATPPVLTPPPPVVPPVVEPPVEEPPVLVPPTPDPPAEEPVPEPPPGEPLPEEPSPGTFGF